MNIAQFISLWWKDTLDYKERTLKDGGTTKREDVVQQYNQMCKSNGIFDSIKFAWLGEAGGKLRNVSASENRWNKLYSLVTMNDATQTTSTSQPYLTGNIAPTERIGMKNPNGGSNYMTHPTISFAANEAWSVTTVLNWNGNTNSVNSGSYAGGSQTVLRFHTGSDTKFQFVNSTTSSIPSGGNPNKISGKTSILTWVANGSGNIYLYINGVQELVFSASTNSEFYDIFRGRTSNSNCLIFFHIIRAQALTLTQVQAEANFLRTLYPEIPSVTIGTQTWATSNCDMVGTPQGNLIANVTDNTAWANSTTLYTNAYNAASGTEEQKVYAGVKAAAMWSFYSNDVALGSVYGKLYNWYAVKLLQMDIDYYNAANPTTPWGWKVPTDTDFNTLATYLGGASVAGGKMKKDGTIYWLSPNTGATNNSGFTAVGSSYRLNTDGSFVTIKSSFYMWSITGYIANVVYNDITMNVIDWSTVKSRGVSIRLIKN